MKKIILLSTVTILLVYINGCGNQNFTKDSIPKEKFLVGGGYQFEYKAPAQGICYLVDADSGKVLTVKSIDKDKMFDETFDPGDKDLQESLRPLGINTQTMKLKLYFIPSSSGGR